MFCTVTKKIRELFRRLQLYFVKASTLNLTDVLPCKSCEWIRIYFRKFLTIWWPQGIRGPQFRDHGLMYCVYSVITRSSCGNESIRLNKLRYIVLIIVLAICSQSYSIDVLSIRLWLGKEQIKQRREFYVLFRCKCLHKLNNATDRRLKVNCIL
jgi:hypothetical protein